MSIMNKKESYIYYSWLVPFYVPRCQKVSYLCHILLVPVNETTEKWVEYQNSSKKQKKNNETVREEGVTICGKMQRIYLKS